MMMGVRFVGQSDVTVKSAVYIYCLRFQISSVNALLMGAVAKAACYPSRNAFRSGLSGEYLIRRYEDI
jgi:hypothetical protein